MLYLAFLCNGIATRRVEPAHRLVKSHFGRVKVRIGLADVRVSEHRPDVVEWPGRLKPTGTGFVSQIVEV